MNVTYLKYAGAAALVASAYALVILGKLEVNTYMMTVVSPVLVALGIHGSVTTPFPTKDTTDAPKSP